MNMSSPLCLRPWSKGPCAGGAQAPITGHYYRHNTNRLPLLYCVAPTPVGIELPLKVIVGPLELPRRPVLIRNWVVFLTRELSIAL
jgi:hypothetical protein